MTTSEGRSAGGRAGVIAALPLLLLALLAVGCVSTDVSTGSGSESEPPLDSVFRVQIAKINDNVQGNHELIDVTVTEGAPAVCGFDLIIGYDSTALTIVDVVPGDFYSECGWEYFAYRQGIGQVPCDEDGCPGGRLRVAGLADANNGPVHPDPTREGNLLFTVDFLVADDPQYSATSLPIRFFWRNCGDNTVRFCDGNCTGYLTDAVAREVYELNTDWVITDSTTGFPSLHGWQSLCGPSADANRLCDFINGGIDIIPPESVSVSGVRRGIHLPFEGKRLGR